MRNLIAGLVLIVACGGNGAGVEPGPDAAVPWNLTWTHQGGTGPRPDLTGTTTLTVDGLQLTYGGGPGGEIHTATDLSADGCLNVPDDLTLTRRSYHLCPTGTGMDAEIQWTIAFSTVWRVQAWR